MAGWEALSNEGWTSFGEDIHGDSISEQLEENYKAKKELRFQCQFTVRGRLGRSTKTSVTSYKIDWETYEQVNRKTNKRRQIRRAARPGLGGAVSGLGGGRGSITEAVAGAATMAHRGSITSPGSRGTPVVTGKLGAFCQEDFDAAATAANFFEVHDASQSEAYCSGLLDLRRSADEQLQDAVCNNYRPFLIATERIAEVEGELNALTSTLKQLQGAMHELGQSRVDLGGTGRALGSTASTPLARAPPSVSAGGAASGTSGASAGAMADATPAAPANPTLGKSLWQKVRNAHAASKDAAAGGGGAGVGSTRLLDLAVVPAEILAAPEELDEEIR